MTLLMILSIIATVVIGYFIYRDTETEDNDIIE
ncbi:Tumor necrosis factor receptor superfamily member 19 [Lacicoccus alkaliphilus]